MMSNDQFVRSAVRWTFEDAERSYRAGWINQDQYEAFQDAWSSSCARFSSLAVAPSTIPAVVVLSALLKAEAGQYRPYRPGGAS